VHASLIEGGLELSTYPDRCLVSLERRTLPGETVATVEADVEALLARCRAADPELVVSARTTLARDPFLTADDAEVLTALSDAVSAVTGAPAARAPMSYWADSAFIAAAGVPTVLYGPDGDGAHADVEWVSLEGTRTCAAVLTATALAVCG
jgi:acetylornithine deacetylase